MHSLRRAGSLAAHALQIGAPPGSRVQIRRSRPQRAQGWARRFDMQSSQLRPVPSTFVRLVDAFPQTSQHGRRVLTAPTAMRAAASRQTTRGAPARDVRDSGWAARCSASHLRSTRLGAALRTASLMALAASAGSMATTSFTTSAVKAAASSAWRQSQHCTGRRSASRTALWTSRSAPHPGQVKKVARFARHPSHKRRPLLGTSRVNSWPHRRQMRTPTRRRAGCAPGWDGDPSPPPSHRAGRPWLSSWSGGLRRRAR